ncbi:MAG: TdeIII family type II restriction endonuclease, partial [Nanoarchaeota archaeon]|nr:TdeIII family type II restriction endonuclease [Nanoarchaeota archaeon]
MALNKEQKEKIKGLIRTKLNEKLSKYERETTSMPFLTRLMQDPEKVASYSFIHSLATILGQSVYEQTAKII